MVLTKRTATPAAARPSIRAVTGAPVKFVGTGEKPTPSNRSTPRGWPPASWGWATSSPSSKAQDQVDEKQAKGAERRLRKNEFTLEDFRDQLLRLKKMGSMEEILGMIPGLGAKAKGLEGDGPDEGS